MKKIGIVTFVKCNNYGAELQAYALQKKLNLLGYDAEVINMEKEKGVLESSFSTYKNAILNRYKEYGIVKGTAKIAELIIDKYQVRKTNKKFAAEKQQKDETFDTFFANYIRHSSQYYTLEELRNIQSMPYDVLIAGSDQIWNFMQTRYLDVFFLMMGNCWGAKKISYAASFGVKEIPKDLTCKYREYIENMDAISVREVNGLDIVKGCSSRQATLVLDPTLLLTRDEWVSYIGRKEYLSSSKKYVVIYTLSGSHYIYTLAKKIAKELNVEVINIKNGYERKKGDEGIIHITDAGPQEFISIYNQAAYVITDSFHGTAFSINFNVPFTTLLNPVSNINSRALSILKLTRTESRLIYDDGSNKAPDSLKMIFDPINEIVASLRKDSLDYLQRNI